MKNGGTRTLSKGKLLAFRQCPKRLWLELHRPELGEDSSASRMRFQAGHHVGEVARRLYDPAGKGQLIDPQAEGFAAALARSTELLASSRPIFEAGFRAGNALVFTDVMLPARKAGKRMWRLIEVKSSADVKAHHRDETALQAFVAKSAGVPLASVALAHIDNTWVYPGGEDYRGLLKEIDLTADAASRRREVKTWIAAAQAVARKRTEPAISTGAHCDRPYACNFLNYCQGREPQAEYPVAWLHGPRNNALEALIEEDGVSDLRDIPDDLLSELQRRVKAQTLSGRAYFDAPGAAADLSAHKLPAYFLDFETISLPVPVWKGARPYQATPFQFSIDRLARTGKLSHQSFLDLSGNDPSKPLAEALIAACGERGPVFVYNAGFEGSCIRELAARFPRMKRALLAINERLVDLFKVSRKRYYHPDQHGSWSIKAVLPTVAPDLTYENLDGVQEGAGAMDAYLEAIHPGTTKSRKEEIQRQLLAYCALDTYAMVRLWQFFAGREDLRL